MSQTRLLALVTGLALFGLVGEAASQTDQVGITLIGPPTDGRVDSNPFAVNGTTKGNVHELTIRSKTAFVTAPIVDERFEAVIYVWRDLTGPVTSELRKANEQGTGEVLGRSTFAIPDYDITQVETELAAAEALDDPTESVASLIDLHDRLKRAGHPIFASVAADRAAARATRDNVSSFDLQRARLEDRVILGDVAGTVRALDTLDSTLLDRPKAELAAASRLLLITRLAASAGFPRNVVDKLLTRSNQLRSNAGQLPRKLPSGY